MKNKKVIINFKTKKVTINYRDCINSSTIFSFKHKEFDENIFDDNVDKDYWLTIGEPEITDFYEVNLNYDSVNKFWDASIYEIVEKNFNEEDYSVSAFLKEKIDVEVIK
jgi:hypothetical protein